MNTYDVAKYWRLELHDAVWRMAEKGIFVLNPKERLHKAQLALLGIDEHDVAANEELSPEREDNAYDDNLEQYVANNVILIDCCSLLKHGSETLLSQLIPCLIKYKRKLIIPLVVMSEIEKLERKDPTLADTIAGVKFMLKDMVKRDLVMFVKSEEDAYFADPVFLSHFHQLRLKTNILFITQDNDLSYDVLCINNTRSVKSRHRITVCKVSDNGRLIERMLTPEGDLKEIYPAVRTNEPVKPSVPDGVDQVGLFNEILGRLVSDGERGGDSTEPAVATEKAVMSTQEVFDSLKKQLSQGMKQ